MQVLIEIPGSHCEVTFAKFVRMFQGLVIYFSSQKKIMAGFGVNGFQITLLSNQQK
ncbi:MAG: hypothetical protein ABIN25_14015 [Ginsengibacter sp.]